MNADNSNPYPSDLRYDVQEVIAFATQLLIQAGMEKERAGAVAEILVEGDLMGHTTHGLQLLSPYLKDLTAGKMAPTGDPDIIADSGAAFTWDGRYLPGPWLVVQAMDLMFERIRKHPVVTAVIKRSHHIGCLAAYPKRATDRGLLMLLTCSDPSTRSVAPYGGIQPLVTPNPIAAGIPTRGEPVIMDISMSCTANGTVARTHAQKRRLPGTWLLDSLGNLSDDPADVLADPPGSILPLGGAQLGYKGFALAFLVEALTAALGGHGRADKPDNWWGASVFLQIIDPDGFGGRNAFLRETEWLATACRDSATRPDDPPVRLPGNRALALRRKQLRRGITLYPGIMPGLTSWSQKLDVVAPVALTD